MLTFGILATLGLLIALAVALYNGLVRSRIRVREAWSTIEVQLRRRASLLPNLMETVRAYAAHERGTFEAVTRARGALEQAGGAAESAQANDSMSRALGHLFAVAESYPELRASANFKELQDELSDVEEKIAYARQFYNRNVLDFNARIEVFPGVLIARAFGFLPAEFFEADEEGRGEVKLDFDRGRVASAPPASTP
ncbi:MAG: LemA family protein [Deltaproteobacteria bacterium]|jgi:LemA protein|nr:LemA family protein [Deltaproteobacteria bacterium]MBW2386368.1 LemA family protein [Deltaproteobacteria bacterium]MBW2698443.1 LemA family protein [Deltaproteobacteria bacterium]